MAVSFITIKIEVQSLNTGAVAKVYFQGGESPIINLGTLGDLLSNQGEMGDRLFNFLFKPKNQDDPAETSLFKWFQVAISSLQGEEQRLRVQLQINEAPCMPCMKALDEDLLLKKKVSTESDKDRIDWISILPWELMLQGIWKEYQNQLPFKNYLQNQSPSLVRVLQSANSISLETQNLNKSYKPNPVLRVLFAWANPQVNPRERQFSPTLGEEITNKIKQKFEILEPLLVVKVIEKATLNEITDIIRDQRFDIIHILTHGDLDPDQRVDYPRLLLNDKNGNPDPIGGGVLTNSLCQAGHIPQIVFLQACQSATTTRHYHHGIAQSLIQGGVNFVVAMQAVINLDEALGVTKIFYQELVKRQPIDLALLKARAEWVDNKSSNRIGNPVLARFKNCEPLPAWAVPVLFMSYQAANGNGYLEQGSLPKAIRWEDGKVMLLVKLSNESFYVDKYPVTAGQYGRYLKANNQTWENPWKDRTEPEKIPATNMTVAQAQGYATHYGKRIPTLERWRQAASGGSTKHYPWGDTFDGKRCHVDKPGRAPLLVNYYPAQNDVGVCDIVGNVAEMASEEGEQWHQCGGCYEFGVGEGRTRISAAYQQPTLGYDVSNKAIGFRCIVEITDYVNALKERRSIDESDDESKLEEKFPKLA